MSEYREAHEIFCFEFPEKKFYREHEMFILPDNYVKIIDKNIFPKHITAITLSRTIIIKV